MPPSEARWHERASASESASSVLRECHRAKRGGMKLNVLTAVVGVLLLLVILELLRRRQLREKYAVLWIVVGLGVIPLAVFPRGLDSVARLIGVASGVSLVLFLGVVLLLLICTHLSWEVSQLEE